MKKIHFLCIGGKRAGMGHIVRSLKMARAVKAKYNKVEIGFIVCVDKESKDPISIKLKPLFETVFIEDTHIKIEELLVSVNTDLLIVDRLSYDTTAFRAMVPKIIALDNYHKGADSYINILKDTGFHHEGIEYNGYEYWIIDEPPQKKRMVLPGLKQILVTCGYTDPNRITEKILKALTNHFRNCSLEMVTPHITCIVTSLYQQKITEDLLEINPSIVIKKDLVDIGEELLKSDLCFNLGGNTMVETIGIGIPSVVVADCPKNHELALILKNEGYIMGVLTSDSLNALSDLLNRLTPKELFDANARCLRFNGYGMNRIINIIDRELRYGR